jgi:hypothetical protein
VEADLAAAIPVEAAVGEAIAVTPEAEVVAEAIAAEAVAVVAATVAEAATTGRYGF